MPDYFENIFVAEPAHNFEALQSYTESIRFVCSGYEDVDGIKKVALNLLAEFNPDTDAFIPVGRVLSTFVLAAYLGQKFSEITIGIYKDGDYVFRKFNPKLFV